MFTNIGFYSPLTIDHSPHNLLCMPNVTSYPVFEPDQVLTDTQLNNLFAYLDQQERLTRNRLLGIGIVCGLNIAVEDDAITVTKGVGITSLGYLLQFDGGRYSAYRTYALPDFPETIDPSVHAFYASWSAQLLVEDEKKEAVDKALKEAPDLLRSSAVVLFLEPALTDLKNCTTEDCNDKGKRVDVIVRPLLVPKKVLEQYKYISLQQQKFSFPQIHLKRWNVPVQNMQHPANVMQVFDNILNASLLNEVAAACKFVFDVFNPLLNKDGDVPDDVFTYLTKLALQVRSQSPAFYQYVYGYVDDIIKAYNEFAHVVFDVLSECCPDENLFPLHLMLGEAAISSASSNTAYRNYFIYSPLFGEQKDKGERAKIYYHRLLRLLKDFDLSQMQNTTAVLTNNARGATAIRITPTFIGDAALGKRCIPYYYNPKELFTVWDYEKSRRGTASLNYSYHADAYSNDAAALQPLLYDIEPYNFFRIEGHAGVEVNRALQNIVAQRRHYNLPFDVVALNLYPGNTLAEADKLKCYFSDLESQYNVLVAEMLCKLHGLFCDAGKLAFNKKIFDTIFRNSAGTLNTAAFNNTSNLFAKEAFANTTKEADASNKEEATDDDIVGKIATGRTFEESLQLMKAATVSFVDRARRVNPYQKGTYLRSFCKPDAKAETVSAYYLAWVKANPGKRWPKPPGTGSSKEIAQWTVVLYFHLFYLIDTIEELMRFILPNDLATLNYGKFKLAYDEVMDEVDAYANFIDNFYHFADMVNDQKDIAAQKPFDLLQEEMEAWLVGKIVTKVVADSRSLLMMCVDDRLQQLLFEYRKRIAYVLNQQIFSAYSTLKPGLEHKAGVPKGGTFVMLYYDKPDAAPVGKDRVLAATNLEAAASVEREEKEGVASTLKTEKVKLTDAQTLEQNVSGIEALIERNKTQFAQTELANINSLLSQIRKLPPSAETLRIPEGVVFADLYIPYMCCSDCAPTAFVFQDKKEEEPQPHISMKRTFFCNNEDVKEPVTATPENATVTGQGITQEGTAYFFNPKGLAEDNYVLQCKVGSKSDSINVTVKAVYDPAFTFQQKGINPASGGIIVSFVPSTQAGQHTWSFGDNTATSTDAAVEHTFFFTANEAVFDVTHSITNGNCTLPPAKQTVVLKREAIIQLSMDKNRLCTNGQPQKINFSPANGSMICKENAQAIAPTNDGFAFVPQLSGAGKFTVQYTIAGQTKELSVTVVDAPSAEFDAKIIKASKEARVVQFTSKTQTENHQWKFSDGQTSSEINPVVEFKLAANGEGTIQATHAVSGAVCAADVTKEVSLQLTLNEGKLALCYTTEAVSLEPNLTADASIEVLDAGGAKLDERGLLTINDTTKVGKTSFTVDYIITSKEGVVEKRTVVTVNRLSEEVRLSVKDGGVVIETKAKAVNWTITVNNGQPKVVKQGSENPLRLAIGQEVPRVIELAFIIAADITDGVCKSSFTKFLPGAKYNEFIQGGGEIVL